MDRLKIIENIKRYQSTGYFHPLTCRIDSSHKLLEPELLEGLLVLKCPTCNSIQWEDQIPDMFMNDSLKEMMEAQDEYYKIFFRDTSE